MIIVVILLVPSWRVAFQKTILGWTMGGPDVVKESSGERIPDNWVIYDVEGNPLSFKALNGQKVFINFWASWCAPCLAEMPSLMEEKQKLGSDVVFLFLTNDERDRAMQIINEYAEHTDDFYFYQNYPPALQHNSIPYSVWVRNGKITARFKGSANWEADDILKGFE